MRAHCTTGPDRRQLGRDAEERAARLMSAAGLTILRRNFQCRRGEIDIVATDGAVLVIAEVRLRSHSDFGGAAASITLAKRRRIVSAARLLLARNPSMAGLPVRFDALLISGEENPRGERKIEWLRAAFDAAI